MTGFRPGMHIDLRQVPASLMEPAMDAGQPPEPMASGIPVTYERGRALKPSVGRIVHYVSHGTPVREDGTQAYRSECRAAIVTEVTDDHTAGLCVLNPTGQFFSRDVVFDDDDDPAERAGGTWHWPERVP